MKKYLLIISALFLINSAFSITEWPITCSMEEWNYVVAWGCLTNYPSCGSNAVSSGCSPSCLYCGTQINFCADNTDTSGICACNDYFENCDEDNSNGCEADLRKSINNCGSCGNSCQEGEEYCWQGECTSINHALFYRGVCGALNSQTCNLNSRPNNSNLNNFGSNPCVWSGFPKCDCSADYSNCDQDLRNGCETNIKTSSSNCGSCNNPCYIPREVAWCSNGVCQIEGFDICDETPGIDLKTNNFHCGSCNNPCLPDEEYCWKGICTKISAEIFYRGICDNQEPTCINSVADSFTPDKLKNIAPTTWESSTINCALSGDPKCNCSAGFKNCNLNINDGCEADLRIDNNNCGDCGKSCLAGEYCWKGSCIKINSEQTYVQGSCSATTSVCPANSAPDTSGSFGENTCTWSGLPKCACNQGFVNNDNNAANGCELDLRIDRNNCGAIGKVCGDAPCISGECGVENDYARLQVECGFIFIYNGFVNVIPPYYADNELTPYNEATCSWLNYVNKYGFGKCKSGYKDCNNEAGGYDGCETPISFNENACGNCTNICPIDKLCVNGQCVNNYAEIKIGCSCVDWFGQTTYISLGGSNVWAPPSNSGYNHDNYPYWTNIQGCSCPWRGWGYLPGGTAYGQCLAGYSSCNNRDTLDGCETNIKTSVSNCGACGNTCYSLNNRCTGAVYLEYETQTDIQKICEVGCVDGKCTKATKQTGYCQVTSDCVKGTFQSQGSELEEGLYFFITTDGKDSIRRFNLATPWNLTTLERVNEATLYYNFDSTIDGFLDAYPRGFFSKSDGLTIYLIEGNNKKVLQYNLGTAFNPATILSATKKSFDYSLQQNVVAEDLFIGDSGTKLYLIMENNIYQYDLGTAWDISTTIYNNNLLDVNTYDSSPKALFFNTEGTKLYILGDQNNAVFQLSLNPAWDISTASIDTVTETSETITLSDCNESQTLNPNDNTCVTPFCNNDNDCYEEGYDIICHNDGRWNSECIFNYEGYPGDDPVETIIIPDPQTITYNVFVSINDAEPQSIFFSPDGSKLFAIGSIEEKIMSWDLINPWDLSTAFFSENNYANIKTYSTKSTGLSFSPDGTKMFVMGDGGLYEFSNVPALSCTGGIEYPAGTFRKWCCPPDKCGYEGECYDNNVGQEINGVFYFCKLGTWKEVSKVLNLGRMINVNHNEIAIDKLYLGDVGVSQSCTQSNYKACIKSSASYSFKYCFDYNVVFDGIFNLETNNYVPVKVIEQNLANPYFKPQEVFTPVLGKCCDLENGYCLKSDNSCFEYDGNCDEDGDGNPDGDYYGPNTQREGVMYCVK